MMFSGTRWSASAPLRPLPPDTDGAGNRSAARRAVFRILR